MLFCRIRDFEKNGKIVKNDKWVQIQKKAKRKKKQKANWTLKFSRQSEDFLGRSNLSEGIPTFDNIIRTDLFDIFLLDIYNK